MPIYEFFCPNCGEIYEDLCELTQDKMLCPKCDALINRCISQNNFHLKGLGWTDDARKQSQRWFDKIESTGKKKD